MPRPIATLGQFVEKLPAWMQPWRGERRDLIYGETDFVVLNPFLGAEEEERMSMELYFGLFSSPRRYFKQRI